MKKVHIIGSGIIGLFSAYYLEKAGYEVHVIDQSDVRDGCSFQNAGMIVPSHFIPLAAPGMVPKALKWMFDSTSPFYIKPRLDLDFINWAIRFTLSANKRRVKKAIPHLHGFLLESKALFQGITDLDLDLEEKGLLMLCQSQHMLDDEIGVARMAKLLGMKAEVLDRKGVHQLEYKCKPEVLGGVFYPDDAHCNPQKLVNNLKGFLAKKGVSFSYQTRVKQARFGGGRIESITVENNIGQLQELQVDELILSAGSWSGELAKKLKLNMPVQAGKGYSFTQVQNEDKKVIYPSILCEAKVAVTPFLDNSVRFAGTMELSGINEKIEKKRVAAIADAGKRFYPENGIDYPTDDNVWFGLRPCSPDGLPYIGRSNKSQNLTVATGHAMLGISLAPATGKRVANIIQNKEVQNSDDLFNPNRFGN